jgi:uncharacterized protein HemX
MKAIFILLVALGLGSAVFAVDKCEKKEPAQMASEASKTAAALRKEAEHLRAKATSEQRAFSAEEAKFVALTDSEAEWLEKTAAAFGKNQNRLAEKYLAKAGELCKERGELAAKVFTCDAKKTTKVP